MRVLICGASIAGPALAHWLGRCGFDVTVVEIAPTLREGGHAVDFRGDTHLTVLDRMGILDELRALRTGGSPIRFVDAAGRTLLALPAAFAGGDLEVRRADLARVLHTRSAATARYLFGDTVTGVTDTPSGVEVTFAVAPSDTFDLVIGADGIHSTVRRLVFGDESHFTTFHGYQLASWRLPQVLDVGPGSVGHNAPGRFVSVAGDARAPGVAGASVLFTCSSPVGRDPRTRKNAIDRACAGMGWEVPRLLATLPDADLQYFDAITSVHVPAWSRGRVALVGDAAWGATLGGMGTGVAIVGAYVLATALADCRSARSAELPDYRTAYLRYEATMRDYATRCQRGGGRTGRFLAPRTRLGLALRNRSMNVPAVLSWMVREGQKISAEVRLPEIVVPG